MFFDNRREMAQFLADGMTKTYRALSEKQALEHSSSLLKTYIVEAHCNHGGRSGVPRFLETVLGDVFGPRGEQWTAKTGADGDLVCLKILKTEKPFHLYVDLSDSRYWLMHTLGQSPETDRFLNRITYDAGELDRAWLPADFLEQVSRLGSFRGLSLDYDHLDFEKVDAPVESLKMQLWGSKAGDILHLLRLENSRSTSLSKVKIKYWLDRDDPSAFTLDDVKYNGKITARGTSFESHIALVKRICKSYAKQVAAIEQELSIDAVETSGVLSFKGSVVSFHLSQPIPDLQAFAEAIFSSSDPFRLWGVPVFPNPRLCRVHSVDLHVDANVRFEITNESIRMYLPAGACGNSVLRFYTNLQHHYDATVRATTRGGRELFDFQLANA